MMRLWKCTMAECSADADTPVGFDFVSEFPVCPKCGVDGRSLEGRGVVVKRETIHLLVVDKTGPGPIIGQGKRLKALCNPSLKLGNGFRATGEPASVSCPACKAHDDFKGVETPGMPDWTVGKEIKVSG